MPLVFNRALPAGRARIPCSVMASSILRALRALRWNRPPERPLAINEFSLCSFGGSRGSKAAPSPQTPHLH